MYYFSLQDFFSPRRSWCSWNHFHFLITRNTNAKFLFIILAICLLPCVRKPFLSNKGPAILFAFILNLTNVRNLFGFIFASNVDVFSYLLLIFQMSVLHVLSLRWCSFASVVASSFFRMLFLIFKFITLFISLVNNVGFVALFTLYDFIEIDAFFTSRSLIVKLIQAVSTFARFIWLQVAGGSGWFAWLKLRFLLTDTSAVFCE